ncbi:BTAD domain-containing putative transcriptional regulator [Sphaerisporangium sp. B11E5]|uniref:AfsR/SARP family transcriptional regulator n=1 Tax=Sphaerisporangium sp. B11E5 TaxID=3153563 RepID=UPI00325FD584
MPLEEAVDVMWGEEPPASAVNIVHRHVGMLRRLLEPGLPRMATGRWLLREAGGYRLAVDAEMLDLLRFRRALAEARAAGRQGRPEEAVDRYADGLGLWRAPAAAGLPAEAQGHPVFVSLDRERLAAAKEAADVALGCGRVTPLLTEVQRLADQHPLNEPLQSRLVLALWATGHQAEALEAYRRARERLADQLGVDPGPELRAAQRQVLASTSGAAPPPQQPATTVPRQPPITAPGQPAIAVPEQPAIARPEQPSATVPEEPGPRQAADTVTGPPADTVPRRPATAVPEQPATAVPEPPATAVPEQPPTAVPGQPAGAGPGPPAAGEPAASPARPAQLPVDLAAFSGRQDEMARVLSLLSGEGRASTTVVISAIGGIAGIGKTALAVHLAHQVAHRFPDGQLYVNLRGFGPSGTVMDPAEAVRGFLEALGVDPQGVPAGLDAQSALYRSSLSGRRMLIVLDNARDVDQVRPLLPGAAGCLVLVTSRNRLSGLVAGDGAHPLTLDLVSAEDARDFLARRLGAERVAREAGAVEEIIAQCGRLPLALAISAARAAMNPAFPLAALAAELRATAHGLDAFSDPDVTADARAVFSWSYRALTPDAARLFRLLALHPGPDIALPAAASLAGVPVRQARSLAAELTHAGLVTEHLPGRYVLHDLLRLYAAELGDAHDSARDQGAARRRSLDHYLHTAYAAAHQYTKTLIPIRLPKAEPGVTPEAAGGRRQATDWFKSERPVLLEVIRQAGVTGHHRHVWQLVWSLEYFFDRLGYWEEELALARTALDSATELGDPVALAHAHRSVGRACNLLRRDDDARTHLHMALELFSEVGDLNGHASTQHYFGFLAERLGRDEEALGHCEQALALYQAVDDRLGQAMTLNSIGYLHCLLGNPGSALPYCRQALRFFQELGDRHGEAAAWDSLGYAHHLLGQPGEAIPCYHNSLGLFREADARRFEAVILDHLGDAWHDAGNPEAARRAWRDAAAIYTEIDPPSAGRIHAKLDTPPRRPSSC